MWQKKGRPRCWYTEALYGRGQGTDRYAEDSAQ